MAEKRESSRVKEIGKRKVLDEAARRRRLIKSLQNLDKDNHHEDPHENLPTTRNLPKFLIPEEKPEPKKRSSKKIRMTEINKVRCRRNLTDILQDEMIMWPKGQPNYLSAAAPPSRYPPRHFCSVCGFKSNYTCVQCGSRYCCVQCYQTHQDTRCLKWTA